MSQIIEQTCQSHALWKAKQQIKKRTIEHSYLNWQSSQAGVCKLHLALYSNCQPFGEKGTIKCHTLKTQQWPNRMCRPGSAVLSWRDGPFSHLLSIIHRRLSLSCNEHLCPAIVFIIKGLHGSQSLRSPTFSCILAFSPAPSGRCVRRSRKGFLRRMRSFVRAGLGARVNTWIVWLGRMCVA